MNKQFFYKYITNPIAKIIDFCNIPKRRKIARFRQEIAYKNKRDYIETVAKVLIETTIQEKFLNEGLMPNPLFMPIIVGTKIVEAEKIFNEKKKRGDFDDLNVMVN